MRGHTEFALDSTRQFESGKVLLTYTPKTARTTKPRQKRAAVSVS
jgi:hypothetical protein